MGPGAQLASDGPASGSGASDAVREADAFTIQVFFPNFYNENVGVSYTAKSVLEGIAAPGIHIGLTAIAAGLRGSYVDGVINKYLYKYLVPRFIDPVQSVFRASRRRLGRGDIAYFWLEGPAEQCQYFRSNDVLVVREMINCTQQLRRQELNKAYAALGEPDGSGISDELIEQEKRDLLATDLIFCPSPFVKKSIMEYGVPAERCIDTSYGWSAERLHSGDAISSDPGVFTAAFVGTIDVRKGVPVLLEAWAEAKLSGRLLLAGQMRAEVMRRYAHLLQRSDIIQLGFVHDVGSVYRSADVFCLPSWEEGCPQVTLEAMSAGAVPIVTPMGTAGAFSASDDVGIVIPPGDVAALSEALRSLANDRARLLHLKQRARERAANYTWELVGQRRRAALLRHRHDWLQKTRAHFPRRP
jgi:glycosyltransferase involved in cell wall biosynthesis